MEEFIADNLDLRLLDALQQDASRSNQDLALALQISPATCLRRIRRLREAGLIERQMAVLSADRLAAIEARAVADSAVQQCYRVSPGPDFVLIVRVADMPGYAALAQRLFTSDANVRNVKAFFSMHRAKFRPLEPLGPL
jgi:DNA-binding Lrp family transcriptional regulator